MRKIEHILAVLGMGLHSSTPQHNVTILGGIRWVPSVDIWVLTRHKLDTKWLTYQNGLGRAEKWTSVSPWCWATLLPVSSAPNTASRLCAAGLIVTFR